MSEILDTFEVVDKFDRTWYGRFEKDPDTLLILAWARLDNDEGTFDDLVVTTNDTYLAYGMSAEYAEAKVRRDILGNVKEV